MRDWHLFRDPGRYINDLLETRGQDDWIVDTEVRYVLRAERFRWRLRHPVRAWNTFKSRVRGLWHRLRYPPGPKKSVAEVIAEKVSTDPEAAGFTKEAIMAREKELTPSEKVLRQIFRAWHLVGISVG